VILSPSTCGNQKLLKYNYNMTQIPDRLSFAPISTVEGYAEAFRRGEATLVEGLCGRILRGKTVGDFHTLSDDPNRKLVMLIGPDALSQFIGQPGLDMLLNIGYTHEYIAQKIAQGTQFKLAILPESDQALSATWANTINLVATIYPEASSALHTHHYQLANTDFTTIEAMAEYSFTDVDAVGPSHPNYMTYERFLRSPQDLVSTRAFLFFTVYLKELFARDGFTYTPEGRRGLAEYIALNQPLSSFSNHALLELKV